MIDYVAKCAELERTLVISARQINTALVILQDQDTDVRNHDLSLANNELLAEFGLKKESRVKLAGIKK